MDSSSENSFAWTDTSSDSFNSASMAGENENVEGTNIENRKKKSRKSSLTNDLELQSKVEIKEETEYCVNKSNGKDKKKKIKIEPDSENEKGEGKKKSTQLEHNGHSHETSSYDEAYLDMKVKQEEVSSSSKHKKKKKKRTSSIDSTSLPKSNDNSHINSSSETCTDNIALKQESDSEMSKSKKKKKKSKKRYDSDNDDVQQNMDIDESDNRKEKTYSKHNETYTSAVDNDTLHNESDESGCDEISAIKCDDSHSLHTISFINKSIDDEITEINHNSSLIPKLDKKSNPEPESNKTSVVNKRTQSISDRIRFEDDEDTNIESSQLVHDDSFYNKKPSKLKQFLKANPNLKLITETFNNNKNLTQDDEIWILKCPKNINIVDFQDTTLNIFGKCKIKVGGQAYEGSAEEQSGTLSLLTMEHSSSKIKNVPLSGIINMRKRIPKAHFQDDSIMINNQTNFIPLPDTKCRHPLFGSNYKKALKIPAAIAERLSVQQSEKSRTEKKKKKNKKDKSLSEHVSPEEQSDVTMKPDPDNSLTKLEKKKKKRKITDDEDPVPKKIKRVKHDPESAEAWESEKAIEENLFNF
ncbi:hypothetical protein B5X24_HaOG204925 [Helicoverpa armigera]|uniref:Uncharacterized protein n=1 Tax=Helicoverpa armigera TaxID=29058 RepID=A0A2W1BPG8_HELAM|nr:hypothetical protein B5X24_HaOG204925 [Helicoverpa armigera]